MGGGSVQIRPAGQGDTLAVHELVQRAYAPYVARIGRPPGPMTEDYTVKVERGQVWIAGDNDDVVGLIVLIEESDHLLIENVAVDPGRQGEGLGRALLAFAEIVARKAGLPTLRLYTNAAMTENLIFYPRLGYEEVDRRTDNGFERVFFVKRLHAHDGSDQLGIGRND
jgi:N-acetylglutamate synthase-like GNAT family acetyltransferase